MMVLIRPSSAEALNKGVVSAASLLLAVVSPVFLVVGMTEADDLRASTITSDRLETCSDLKPDSTRMISRGYAFNLIDS